jgi:hypothetical protein
MHKVEQVFLIITFLILLFGAWIAAFKFGYEIGNGDGLKKAYRYEMFKKYPEYFGDWNMYGAEIKEREDWKVKR